MPFIITFEIEEIRRVSLVSALKGLGDWSAMTSSSYLVATDAGAGGIMETLQPLLGPADSLWVISAAGPWAGYGNPEADDHAVSVLGRDDAWTPKDWDEATKSRP